MTSSLGREIENYDQYCDAIETHLVRQRALNVLGGVKSHFYPPQRNAIAVLHRDLANQEAKARQAEEEARAKAAPPAEAASGDDSSMPPPPNLPSYDRETMSPSIGRTPNRRQSVISMSALQRPTAKHPELKLDLSATSLRLTAEEAASMFSVSSGLASPVTLAPRSARPLGPDEFDADMMVAMASANSDGGHQDALNLAGFSDASGPVGASGSSADQPIELDLDAIDASLDMDLFGDGPESGSGVGDSLFSPAPSMDKIKMEDTDEALFSDDLFGTIPEASTSGGGTIQDGPSPGTLLASFGPENAQDSQAPLDLGQFSFDGDLGMGMDMGGSDLSGVDPLLGLPEISNVDFMGMTTDNSGGQ